MREVPDRAEARLEAHRLVQRVQVSDCGDEVARRLAEAESGGWSEVVRVLLYVELVQAWIQAGGDREGTIEALRERAERDGDPVLLASALASRAEYRCRSGSASVREQANRDLARAAALLEVSGGAALERGTAYIDCGLAYGQRELWELEEEMYERAAALLGDCEEPLLDRPLSLNRAIVNVHTACSLRETGEQQELRALWDRAADLPSDIYGDVLDGTPGEGFGVELRVARHLLAHLVGRSRSSSRRRSISP